MRFWRVSTEGFEIDDEIGRGEKVCEEEVDILIRFVISFGHVALDIEIFGEYLGIFVDGAILDDGFWVVEKV